MLHLNSSSKPDSNQIRRLAPQLASFAFLVFAGVLILNGKILLHPAKISETRDRLSTVFAQTIPSNQTSSSRPSIPERVVRALFYLKLHKTGSSTIAHHLLTFTRNHGLSTLRAPGHILVATPNPTPQKYDAIVAHHVLFNFSLINSYMKRHPDLVITSIRLPLQRQVSWFQQQNANLGDVSCDVRNETLLSYFDNWYPKRMAPQISQTQEVGSREALNGDVEKILDQFDFVFVKERLKESFECFCEKTGIRLCSDEIPLVKRNVRSGTCVEKQLLRYRAAELLRGGERDLLLYEAAGRRLGCRASVWCRCPVEAS